MIILTVLTVPCIRVLTVLTVPCIRALTVLTVPCIRALIVLTVPCIRALTVLTVPCIRALTVLTVPYITVLTVLTGPYITEGTISSLELTVHCVGSDSTDSSLCNSPKVPSMAILTVQTAPCHSSDNQEFLHICAYLFNAVMMLTS